MKTRHFQRQEYQREYNRKYNTGFSSELVARLRVAQGGRCAMPACGVELNQTDRRKMNGESADHDHVSGMPRGLLCRKCNLHLGIYEKMKTAAEIYLASPPVQGLE